MRLTPQEPWYRILGRRMLTLAWLKGFGTPAFMAAFFAAYLPLLQRPAFEPTTIPAVVLDQWIEPQNWAVYLYVSLWLYVSLPPALMASFRELLGYGVAAAALSAAGFACFFFWPTVLPSSGYDWSELPALAWLKGMDESGNSCPSMHVAFAVFSGLWLHGLLKDIGVPRFWRALNALWCAGIVYSTMATKQHVVIDVAAGLVLGAFASSVYARFTQRRSRASHALVTATGIDELGAASTSTSPR